MTLDEFLKSGPVAVAFGRELFTPAYIFATAEQDGVGFVNGDAAFYSPAKECHLTRGTARIDPEISSIVVDDGFRLWLHPDHELSPPDVPRLLAEREAFLKRTGFTREQALDYLQGWFPEQRFIP